MLQWYDQEREKHRENWIIEQLALRSLPETTFFRIEVSSGLDVVAVHPRSYRRNEVIMELEHYLPILERKPHAGTHATVVRRLPKPFTELREYMVSRHSRGYKDFLAVLLPLREHTLVEIAGTIEELGTEQATAAAIHQKLSPVVLQIVQTEDVATRK